MRLQRKSRHQFVRGVCNFLDSVSPQQEFEAMDRPVLQLSFSWQAKENASLRCEDRPTQKTQREDRGPDPKQGKERGPWLNFGSSFYMFFSPPPDPALCKLGQPGRLFVLPKALTLVLEPSFVLFSWAFSFFVFQPLPLWTLFPILTT